VWSGRPTSTPISASRRAATTRGAASSTASANPQRWQANSESSRISCSRPSARRASSSTRPAPADRRRFATRRSERLLRTFKGGRAAGPAFLEDYAFLIAALLDLYEADADPHWLHQALSLQETLDAHYADELGGGYFNNADDHERLLAREKPGQDGALPSGNSIAAQNLLRLAELTGEDRYRERASKLFSAFHETLTRSPTALSEMLLALGFQLEPTKEIVVIQPPSGGDLATMLAPLRSAHLPNRILVVATEGEDLSAHSAAVPLLAGKLAQEGKVTAYVCENRVCKRPTTDPETFAGQIRSSVPGRL
jgi:uncharacterized protein YyaL (SSP411 family)